MARRRCCPCRRAGCAVCAAGTGPASWRVTIPAPTPGLCEDCAAWEGEFLLDFSTGTSTACLWELLFEADLCGQYCGLRLRIQDNGDGSYLVAVWLLERGEGCAPAFNPLGWEATVTDVVDGKLDCTQSWELTANDSAGLSTACGWPEFVQLEPVA